MKILKIKVSPQKDGSVGVTVMGQLTDGRFFAGTEIADSVASVGSVVEDIADGAEQSLYGLPSSTPVVVEKTLPSTVTRIKAQ